MRKPFFALLMVLLTLGAVEAMAWLVHCLVYGENLGQPTDVDRQRDLWPHADRARGRALHPFYGWVERDMNPDLGIPSPRPASAASAASAESALVVALFGGSVANDVARAFQSALYSHFSRALELDADVSPLVFVNLAHGVYRQPLQALAFANMLANGTRFDIVVSLDGFNEVAHSVMMRDRSGAFFLYPDRWFSVVGMTADERRAAGRILALRDEQEYLMIGGGGGNLRQRDVRPAAPLPPRPD